VTRPKLEIADIFRAHGPAWRRANAGHVSLSQFKAMSAIEACRTEALGGHVAGCTKCGHHHIAYNSCKNRHCPKCQGPAARDWMAARAEDLLPVQYFHVVFTLPAEIARIAYGNKKAVYGLLFRASAETVMTIAAESGQAARASHGAEPRLPALPQRSVRSAGLAEAQPRPADGKRLRSIAHAAPPPCPPAGRPQSLVL
jgi:hypothetical protein